MALPRNSQDVENFIVFGTVNTFHYTNHRGKTALRTVVPLCLRFDATPYHRESQWLLECLDVDKNEYRTFALKDIHPR